MTRSEKAAARKTKESSYADLISLNIKMRPGSHSDYIEGLIKKNPQDQDVILMAERKAFNRMRG